jgi:hypothetical protein
MQPETPLRESHDVGIMLQHKIERLDQVCEARHPPLLTHSLSLTHSLARALTHLLTCPLAHSLAHSLTHSLTYRLTSRRRLLLARPGGPMLRPRRLPSTRGRRPRPVHAARLQDATGCRATLAKGPQHLTERRAAERTSRWRRGGAPCTAGTRACCGCAKSRSPLTLTLTRTLTLTLTGSHRQVPEPASRHAMARPIGGRRAYSYFPTSIMCAATEDAVHRCEKAIHIGYPPPLPGSERCNRGDGQIVSRYATSIHMYSTSTSAFAFAVPAAVACASCHCGLHCGTLHSCRLHLQISTFSSPERQDPGGATTTVVLASDSTW